MTNDYLKAFIIGTSGIVLFQHFSLFALKDKAYSTINYYDYSIAAPLYYGLMNMLSLFIGSIFNLSLEVRLFIISLISIIFIVSFNYLYSRKHYKPYKDYTTKEWLIYIINNGTRHIVSFNLIMYYLEKFFPMSFLFRAFIIGSSAISYLITYWKVSNLDKQGFLNYDYKTFTVFEPFIQGFELLFVVFIGKYILKLSLINTLILRFIIGNILWLFMAKTFKTYKYSNQQWIKAFKRILLTGVYKGIIFYYLLKKYI